MKFNEDSRVKIPSIIHLTKLGYKYLSLKNTLWDKNTNIFTNIFKKSIANINKNVKSDAINRLLEDITLLLDNEDLGHAFYEKLIENSGIKLIDFDNFENNSFNVITELPYKNDDDEFRPDIILLINGMPLIFIEVKKPNNREGILAERDRINKRFQNKNFRRFINITQLMVFSNNMEYDNESSTPIQGVFYASSSYNKPIFNYFREEEKFDLSTILRKDDEEIENFILKDNNLVTIKHNEEFATNKSPNTPTNRALTSLFSMKRISFLLQYSIAYVKETKGIEKHIMRYPQFFATLAIKKKLNLGVKKGIIWHTQGSGKTALAFYNVRYLIDYFKQKQIIPKFYFIVDRLDLLIQAKKEFTSRGLIVHTVNSREDFIKDIKSINAINNLSGKSEITVINIQKFSEESNVVNKKDYDINIQRIYFLDEVHRSYNPRGSFLANLTESDPNAIKIGLTGTPLLGDDYNSRSLFGDYIHKYYYNDSIADGYTLRLIREEIETSYKIKLEQALRDIEVLKGDIEKSEIYSHQKFVEPMLDYIIKDFEKSKTALSDNTIGGMVVCDSSKQAKKMYETFINEYSSQEVESDNLDKVDETKEYYDKNKEENKVKKTALILHDIGTKKERETLIEEFKNGKIDLLFVYNMLLTGFDAKRLKKLYLGRVVKSHNLLQTLTRVNRPYKDFKYGYVVDFADIRKEFDATNKAYFDELQSELGDEMQYYTSIFKSKEEIEAEIREIKEILFHFNIKNAEIFSQQISKIEDRAKMLEIKKALAGMKSLFNIIRLQGHYDLLEKDDFRKIAHLYNEASNHLELLNKKITIENNADITNLLNTALEDVLFMFTKISEEELVLADKLKNTLRKTREAMASNFDKKDSEFISLKEELERLFKKKKLTEISQEEMTKNISELRKIYDKVKELNRQNDLLKAKYENDSKYARVHKRLIENQDFPDRESQIFEALFAVKNQADNQILQNQKILNNKSYFNKTMIRIIIDKFINKYDIKLDVDASKLINNLIVKEYMNEYNGWVA